MPVPNTTTFTLQSVTSSLGLGTSNLAQCVTSENAKGGWDATYSGSKNSLLNFRNSGVMHFAVVNKVARAGVWTREIIDGLGYELYQKPSAANNGLSEYTLLASYAGNAYLTQFGELMTYSNGRCITNVSVTADASGNNVYTIASNSRGNQFYITLVQPYL